MMSIFDIDPEIAKARTLDSSFYTNEAYFQVAKEKLFSCSWQFAGNTDQIKNSESVLPLVVLDKYLSEPLILVKDKENVLRCLSNACTHRGNLLVYEKCNALKQITCKYHGRSFHLDGIMKFMPEFKEVEDFPAASDNLTRLPLFKWGKLLFTSLNPIYKAEDFFAEMITRFDAYSLDDLVYREDLSKDFIVEANWALYTENYLEGFHIPFVHAGLNEIIDYSNYKTELFKYSNLQIGLAKEGQEYFDLPAGSKDHGQKIAAYYFWVFPNLMCNFYPWGLSLNIIEPQTTSASKIRFLCFVYDEQRMNLGAGADLNTVEFEDEEIVMNVQKGVRSRFYKSGRYSVTKEQGTHHFHRLIADFFNQ